MRRMGRIVMVGLMAMLLPVSFGAAKSRRQNHQQGAAQYQRDSQQQGGETKQQVLSGKVVQSKEVKIRGTQTKNKVVMLQLPDNRTMLVDLGPVDNKQIKKIDKGTDLTVRGQVGRVGDMAVLFAESVTMNGQTERINRQYGKGMQEQSGRATQGAMGNQLGRSRKNGAQSREISGTIVQSKKVKIQGTKQEHQVVMLQTGTEGQAEKGRQMVVDLGLTDKLKGLNLKKGQRITVMGEPARVGNQMVFMAQSVIVSGKVIHTEHYQQGQGMEEERGQRSPSRTREGQSRR